MSFGAFIFMQRWQAWAFFGAFSHIGAAFGGHSGQRFLVPSPRAPRISWR